MFRDQSGTVHSSCLLMWSDEEGSVSRESGSLL